MKFYIVLITLLIGSFGFSQDIEAQLKAEQKATNLVFKANELVGEDNYVEVKKPQRMQLLKTKSTEPFIILVIF